MERLTRTTKRRSEMVLMMVVFDVVAQTLILRHKLSTDKL